MLRSIARPIDGCEAAVIFKGGTSLSKGWKLIRRMSEDVDILVAFGSTVSKGARDRVLEVLVERTATDIGIAPTGGTSSTSVHRSSDFEYPHRHAHPALTGQRVLLELGTRGGPEPHERCTIRSLVSEVSVVQLGVADDEFDELVAFEIDTLSRERTLFEKLAALHHLASSVERDPRGGRLGTKLRHAYT